MGAGCAGRLGRLGGLVAATVTPMEAGGTRTDPGAMRELAALLAERGVRGLFVTGTTGEGPRDMESLPRFLQVAERPRAGHERCRSFNDTS